MMIMLMIMTMNEFADCHMWLIGLGSPFSLHSPSAGGIEVFVFVTFDSFIGNSIWPPPVLPQLYSRRKWHFISRLFRPVLALCSRSIYYLGQSSVLCELIAIYVLLSFVEQLKCRKVKILTDNQSAARELSFGGFKVLQSVALSTFHVCFCMVLPSKRSGFLDCSTEGWSFALFHLTRMIRKPIPLCFKSLKPKGSSHES